MARKTRKSRGGGHSLFGKKRPTRSSSSRKRSAEKRKKNLKLIMKGNQIDKLKQSKCLVEYKKCMGVSRRRSH
jgi:hypothetical protein|tara:strand:- start:220 stop:438 length:219 start_codon:yes stop_codon:yes gene_type:complete